MGNGQWAMGNGRPAARSCPQPQPCTCGSKRAPISKLSPRPGSSTRYGTLMLDGNRGVAVECVCVCVYVIGKCLLYGVPTSPSYRMAEMLKTATVTQHGRAVCLSNHCRRGQGDSGGTIASSFLAFPRLSLHRSDAVETLVCRGGMSHWWPTNEASPLASQCRQTEGSTGSTRATGPRLAWRSQRGKGKGARRAAAGWEKTLHGVNRAGGAHGPRPSGHSEKTRDKTKGEKNLRYLAREHDSSHVVPRQGGEDVLFCVRSTRDQPSMTT